MIRHVMVVSMFRVVLGILYYVIYNSHECLTANAFTHRCLWRKITAYWRETEREREGGERERKREIVLKEAGHDFGHTCHVAHIK